LAIRSSNLSEKANAFAALKRLQCQFDLSDVELTFIAEYWQHEPTNLRARSERRDNPLESIMALLAASRIILGPLEQEITVSLWALHTYIYRAFAHTPRLLIRSTEPGCGKTTLLSFLERIVHCGYKSDHVTPAVIYHRLKDLQTTFLLDEMENSKLWDNNRLLLNVFDSGHRYDGKVSRVVKNQVVEYPTYAPLSLALIVGKRLAPQLLSRSIVIDMEAHSEGLDQLIAHDRPELTQARYSFLSWAENFQRPKTSNLGILTGRTADNFRTLIEVADDLGYGDTARAAALALHRPHENPVNALVSNIHRVFEGSDRFWTEELLSALHQLEDASWDEFWGLDGTKDPHKLRRGELYQMLRAKRIYSKSVQKVVDSRRISRKGFMREQFGRVWDDQFTGTSAQPKKIIRLAWHKTDNGRLSSAAKDGED
jgi:hypothetical protein